MIEINVKCIESGRESTKVYCKGSVRGNGDDLRCEMVGVLIMFDEVEGGEILCDAFGEFLAEKMARKAKGAKDDD